MPGKKILIGNSFLSINLIEKILSNRLSIALHPAAKNKITRCRKFLEEKLKDDSAAIYGVNTGFGALHHVKISPSQIETLQHNLVRSHACGTGNVVREEIVRLMLLIKINSLAQGYSGVRLQLVERLVYFFNNDILPVVYEEGSLGASGDLAPLAHLSLPIIGEGEVIFRGKNIDASVVHKKLNIISLTLVSKEGLALLNGTQYMNACGLYLCLQARKLLNIANRTAALSLDAYDCHTSPFDADLNALRRDKSQSEVARQISVMRKGSEMASRKKYHVQDPYSFRCIPQVHGASMHEILRLEEVMADEANAVTDNPIVIPSKNKIVSGGNFHGEKLAFALDFAAIALSELGSISERRTYLLLSGQRGLLPFLIHDAGLNSGFMIPQYTAAALASMNKQLCTPASVDSIPSSNGQEDHVSMGANAANKALKVLANTERIISIELFTAAQAMEFRRPLKSSPALKQMLGSLRKQIPFLKKDRLMKKEMETALNFLHSYFAE
jgi:histidine ammonia-lyase